MKMAVKQIPSGRGAHYRNRLDNWPGDKDFREVSGQGGL